MLISGWGACLQETRGRTHQSVVTGQGVTVLNLKSVGLDSLWMPPPWNC